MPNIAKTEIKLKQTSNLVRYGIFFTLLKSTDHFDRRRTNDEFQQTKRGD